MLKLKWVVVLSFMAWFSSSGTPVFAVTANSLAQLRALSAGLNNAEIQLAPGGLLD